MCVVVVCRGWSGREDRPTDLGAPLGLVTGVVAIDRVELADPQISRRLSLTNASGANVATIRSVSNALTAAMCQNWWQLVDDLTAHWELLSGVPGTCRAGFHNGASRGRRLKSALSRE
jgi:hypothetical protein